MDKPRTLTASMGATGAGKTTLLDVFANRTSVGKVTGKVCIDGHPRDAAFQRDIGYVQQQDIHFPTSTVRETLPFSTLLRQPRDVPEHKKLSYVEDVIEVLEMDTFADAIIRTLGDRLDLEQRRRLSIGVELAARPQLLLFLGRANIRLR